MLGSLVRATAVLLLASLLVALPGERPAQAATTITLDGVKVSVTARTRQVITVNRTSGYRARVTWWNKRAGDGRWISTIVAGDGRVGYGGLVAPGQRRQGSGTTPLGTVRLMTSFGTHAKGSDWKLPYRRTRAGDFWVGDNASAHYNRFRRQADGGFRWWLPTSDYNASERLTDYGKQYEYAVTTSYNLRQGRHIGYAIFLHVNGSGATAGCVSVPRWFMQRAMRWLRPEYDPRMAVGW